MKLSFSMRRALEGALQVHLRGFFILFLGKEPIDPGRLTLE
jgi:hypothetical protein